MDKFPDVILLHILEYRGFGEARGKNVMAMMRVSKNFQLIISNHIRFEIDRSMLVSAREFMQFYNLYFLTWRQKRDASLEWDDYRGFLIITDFDEERYLYYQRLIRRYSFDPRPVDFPHYKGRMLFYEYPF